MQCPAYATVDTTDCDSAHGRQDVADEAHVRTDEPEDRWMMAAK